MFVRRLQSILPRYLYQNTHTAFPATALFLNKCQGSGPQQMLPTSVSWDLILPCRHHRPSRKTRALPRCHLSPEELIRYHQCPIVQDTLKPLQATSVKVLMRLVSEVCSVCFTGIFLKSRHIRAGWSLLKEKGKKEHIQPGS